MGKRIIQQKRGKASPVLTVNSFRFKGKAGHPSVSGELSEGIIRDFVHCAGHSAPLAFVEYDNGEHCLLIAPEGVKVGDFVEAGIGAQAEKGSSLLLKDIPEGTFVYNIEAMPGDGGKFVRASGTFARVLSKSNTKVVIELPSKKKKVFHETCRANIGSVAGGGRFEKPLLKAGTKFHKVRSRGGLYPVVSGGAMNAVSHPFGNKRSSRKSKAKPVPRNAPPGRKVGMLRPRRTGRKKK
ncbi:50S ribosomal protein L2 [Nanoarchaeota archaeon]